MSDPSGTIGDKNMKDHASELFVQLWDDLATALTMPVDRGILFWPSCHNFPEGPSTVFWVAVMA